MRSWPSDRCSTAAHAAISRRSRVEQAQPTGRRGVPRNVAVPEDQQVHARVSPFAALLATLRSTGLVDDCHRQPVQRFPRDLGQPCPQQRSVIVAPAPDQPRGTLRQLVQQFDIHPVAGDGSPRGRLRSLPTAPREVSSRAPADGCRRSAPASCRPSYGKDLISSCSRSGLRPALRSRRSSPSSRSHARVSSKNSRRGRCFNPASAAAAPLREDQPS